jgi:hypothetical protein
MKRALAALAILALLVSPLQASAAVKSGDVCKKAGITAIANGKKFTCLKIGKRIVWNKGVAVAKPKPTPTPIATPEPTPTPTPTPSSAPIIEKAPTGFNDLVENFKGVYVGAWNSSNAKIAANPPLDVKQNILFGPNTKSPNPQIPEMFALGTRFFAGYAQPKSFDAIYFVYDDMDWASKKLLELYGNPDVAKSPSRNCQSPQRCNGASANLPKNDVGQTNFGIPDAGHPDAYHLKGGIEIHEYAHMVQFMQFQGKPTYQRNGGLGLMPNWFVEGHAHIAGNVASARTLAEYKEFRSYWLNARADGLPGYSPESIESFYEKLAPGKYDPAVNSNVYSIGYFTVEALVSIKGVDSAMDLILLVSNGATWDEAFLKSYGITWKEASPILAKTVSRMFLERY